MTNITPFLFLFFMLLVIPTSTIKACDSSTKVENSSCTMEDMNDNEKSCCDNHKKDDDGCDGKCNNVNCHCPSTISTSIFYSNFELSIQNNDIIHGSDWIFVQHFPKAIYLSIWQLPKIS